MSLSRQLNESSSIVNTFLNERLPQRHAVVDEWRTELDASDKAGQVLTPSVARDVGMAFELRVGLDLARRAHEFPVLQFLPPQWFESLVSEAGYVPGQPGLPDYAIPKESDPILFGWRRNFEVGPVAPKEPMSELALLAAGMHRALRDGICDGAYHKRAYLEFTIEPDHTEFTDEKRDEVVVALDSLWAIYQQEGREQFRRHGEYAIVSPDIAPGFAVADLIMHETVIEIKAQGKPQSSLQRTFDQALMYALLDQHDIFELQKIAVYFGWQGCLLEDGIDKIVTASTKNTSTSFQDLREDISTRLQKDLSGSYLSYMRKKHMVGELAKYVIPRV